MSLPYPGWSVVFNEVPTAAKWSEIGANTDALAAGTGLNTNAVPAAALATNAITLGNAQITSTFTSTTANAFVDVTSLSATVTNPSGGRNLRITVQCTLQTSAAAGTVLCAYVRESSTVLGAALWNQPVTAYNTNVCFVTYVSAPSAGSHTYKVSISQNAAGTMTLSAGAANPAINTSGPALILVEVI